jgi:hypothetical protein
MQLLFLFVLGNLCVASGWVLAWPMWSTIIGSCCATLWAPAVLKAQQNLDTEPLLPLVNVDSHQ